MSRFAFEVLARDHDAAFQPHAHPTDKKRERSDGQRSHLQASLRKCLRPLEIGRRGLGGDGNPGRIGVDMWAGRIRPTPQRSLAPSAGGY